MKTQFIRVFISAHLLALGSLALNASLVETITFGDAASEKNHQLTETRSEVVVGGIGESARRLLAPSTTYWEGWSGK